MRTIKFLRHLKSEQHAVLTCSPQIKNADSALRHLSTPINGEAIYRASQWDLFKILLGMRAKIKNTTIKKSVAKESLSKNTSTFRSIQQDEVEKGKSQKAKDLIHNLFYFPDHAAPWIFPAYFLGRSIVKQDNIDIIFTTGSPWSGLVAGYLISKSTGKPLIADFRDPWINNPFHQSKGKFLDQLAKKIEEKIVHHAAAVSLNTEPLLDEFLERYPLEPRDKFFVMPNGFDESDFTDALSNAKNGRDDNKIIFTHAGFLYGVRDPAVLLNAIRLANLSIQQQTIDAPQLCFRQIGEIQLAYNIRDRYADMIGDGSLILEPSLPYMECLKEIVATDWVVNIQPTTKTQIPSKLYDYLAINKPILNITPRNGGLGRVVTKHALGLLFDFDEQDGLTKALIDIAQKKNGKSEFMPYPARSLFNCQTIADSLKERIRIILDR